MSRIMKAIYAEARAAREMAARAEKCGTQRVDDRSFQRATAQGIDWWNQQRARTTRAAPSDVLIAAVAAIKHPCSPMDHIDWWARSLSKRST